jgi:hypothetical protein
MDRRLTPLAATALAVVALVVPLGPASADDTPATQMTVGAVADTTLSLGVERDGHVQQAGTTIPFDVRTSREHGRTVVTIEPRD